MSSPALPAAASAATPCPKPYREVICADSLQWLSAIPEGGLPPGSVGFTSIPDISELDAMFGGGASADYEGYAEWFTRAAALFMSRLPLASHCMFLQSDVRIMDGDNAAGWIDKAHLCSDAARRAGFRMLWHKMVTLTVDMRGRSVGRPSFSHFICYTNKKLAAGCGYHSQAFAIPDIFHRGHMIWNKGVGLDCCYAGVRFLKDIAHAKLLVDPFCGRGTMIAMANTLGMSSMGIEISKRRCGRALLLDLSGKLHLLSKAISKINTGVDYKNTLDETINIPKAVRKAVAARAAADRIQYELVAMRVADDEPKCEQDERDSTTSI